MAPVTPLDPPIGVEVVDKDTGKVAEVWRIYFRRVGASFASLPPIDASYWVSSSNAALTAERNLAALLSGYLKITVALGIAVPSTTATIPATDLSGTVPTARLGTGVADATTFLRGDQTYAPAGAGATGPAGAMGFGIDGQDGADGNDGPPGPPGTSGASGGAGPTGAIGPMGFGVDGQDGQDGNDGPPGPMGLTGPIGLMGVPGWDGLDAEPTLPAWPNPWVAPDLALSLLAPLLDESVPAGWSAVVNRSYTIASGKHLTLASGARMRVL